MKKKMHDEMYEMLQSSSQKNKDIENAYKKPNPQFENTKLEVYDPEKYSTRPSYFQLSSEAGEGVEENVPDEYIPITRNQTWFDRYFNDRSEFQKNLSKTSYFSSSIKNSIDRVRKSFFNDTSIQKRSPKVYKATKSIISGVGKAINKYSPGSNSLKKIDWKKLSDVKARQVKNVYRGFTNNTKNILQKMGSSKLYKFIGKPALKAFSVAGTATNIHTLRNDTSPFKRALAGIDLIGDAIGTVIPGVSAVTSTLNFAGSNLYDNFLSDETKEKLDRASDNIVFKPLRELTLKRIETINKKMAQPHKIIGKRIVSKDTIPEREMSMKPGSKEIRKPKGKFGIESMAGTGGNSNNLGSLYGNNVLGFYSSHAINSNNMDSMKNHTERRNGATLAAGQIDNSKNISNNFNINIKGSSPTEIMNALMPQLKLCIANGKTAIA